MTVRRIDQGMAAAASLALPEGADAETGKALRTRYRQLRVMLRTAGLAASYAYIASKAGPPDGKDRLAAAYGLVAGGITERLTGLGLLSGSADDSLGTRDVLRQLGAMDHVTYARASAEAAGLVEWLSRLANAVYAEEGGDDAA